MALRTPKASIFGSPKRLHDSVRDHMQTVFALVIPDHIAQVRHASHDLGRHAPCPAEQPAPSQRHKAPVQRGRKEFIDEPERMPPLVESHIGLSPTKVRKVPQDFLQRSVRKGFFTISQLPRRVLV